MKLIYPAIFTKEEDVYYVEFPDLEGCQSFGDTFEETFENSKEALVGFCLTFLENGKSLPKPTPLDKIKVEENSFTSIIETNTSIKDKAVKKTLTIPSWLNDEAIKKDINFSQTLQDALVIKLQLN